MCQSSLHVGTLFLKVYDVLEVRKYNTSLGGLFIIIICNLAMNGLYYTSWNLQVAQYACLRFHVRGHFATREG